MSKKLYLVLENGRIFEGKSFGAFGEATGEIVFTTGMTGYLETLTDPSYYGQIVVQTFPQIGNYGVIPSDFESKSVKVAAYIVRHWCQEPSNFRSEGNLDTFLKSRNVIGLYGIDTRALTRIIRKKGVVRGKITKTSGNTNLVKLKSITKSEQVRNVTTNQTAVFDNQKSKYKVVVIDYGMKESIKLELLERGCSVYVCPAFSSVQDILSIKPDGIVLSNGPGDPRDNPEIIKMLSELQKYGIPILGICLGHLLLAMANGFNSINIKSGHRGTNQPVREIETGRIYITGQNHRYAVDSESVNTEIAKESYKNVNDGTCEGIDYLNIPAFTVQFNCSSPHDTRFIYDRFISMMEEKTNASK